MAAAVSVQPGPLLTSAADHLFGAIASRPELGATIGAAAALIALIAPDLDTYVSDRLHLAAQIKDLLRRAQEILQHGRDPKVDDVLARELATPADFSFRNVQAHLDALKAALMVVHARLEAQEGEAAGNLIGDIWSVLQEEVVRASRRVPGLL